MSQTQNQSKYYYSPRFRHFNIYRRDPDGDTKVDDAGIVHGLDYLLTD